MILGRVRLQSKSWTAIIFRITWVNVAVLVGVWNWFFRGRVVLTIKWDTIRGQNGQWVDIPWSELLLYNWVWWVLGYIWVVGIILVTIFGVRGGGLKTIKTIITTVVCLLFVFSVLMWLFFFVILAMDYFLWPMSKFVETPFFVVNKTLWSNLELEALLKHFLVQGGFNHPGMEQVSPADFKTIIDWSSNPEDLHRIIRRFTNKLERLDEFWDYFEFDENNPI